MFTTIIQNVIKYLGFWWGWAFRGFGLASGVWLFMKLVGVVMVSTST